MAFLVLLWLMPLPYGSGLVALNRIPAGTQILIEDALFPMSLYFDEMACCSQADFDPEKLEDEPGPVDVLCLARAIVRAGFRMINGSLLNASEADAVEDWLQQYSDPGVSPTDFPADLKSLAPILSGKLATLANLYPRTHKETEEAKKSIVSFESSGLNTSLEHFLQIIQVWSEQALGEHTQVDCSPDAIMCRLLLNGLAVQPLEEQFSASALETARGAGIFALTALLNHSCLPNLTRSTVCNTMIVSTIKDITAGEPLLLAYLPTEELAQSTKERQESLKSRDFQCKCIRCSKNQGQAGMDAPDETTLMEAYRIKDYASAVTAAVEFWNAWASMIESVHGPTPAETARYIVLPEGKKVPQLHPYGILDEALLCAAGHLFRSSFLLKEHMAAKPGSDGKLPKWLRGEKMTDILCTSSLVACDHFAKGLFGGNCKSFFLRWLFELSGDFYDPLDEVTLTNLKKCIAEHVSR